MLYDGVSQAICSAIMADTADMEQSLNNSNWEKIFQLIMQGVVRGIKIKEYVPKAVGFYEHMGFETYKRTQWDEEGNPYPLLYMKLME